MGKAVFGGRLITGAAALPPIDPLLLAQTRVTFSVLILVPALLLWRGRGALRLPWADIGSCLVLGTAGLAAANYFYYLAIQRTSVATAILLQYTAPIWVLIWMTATRRQRPTPGRLFAVALAVGGSALAIGFAGGPDRLRLDGAGVAAALASAFAFALYNVLGARLVHRIDRFTVVTWAMLGAALLWLALNPPWRVLAVAYSPGQWEFLGLFALLSSLLPFPLYFAGLRHLDATRAVVTSCLEPIFAILFAALWLGEPFGLLQAAGAVGVLAGTVLVEQPGRIRGSAAIEPAAAACPRAGSPPA
jgi:drug/metabolite transporter (DMT)-like permease